MIYGVPGSGQPWGDAPGPGMPGFSLTQRGMGLVLARRSRACLQPSTCMSTASPCSLFPAWEEALKPEELHTCLLKTTTPGHLLLRALLDFFQTGKNLSLRACGSHSAISHGAHAKSPLASSWNPYIRDPSIRHPDARPLLPPVTPAILKTIGGSGGDPSLESQPCHRKTKGRLLT